MTSLIAQAIQAHSGTGPTDGNLSSSSSSSSIRCTTIVEPTYQRFLVQQKIFNKQFNHVYMKRTQMIRPIVLHEAQQRWQDPEGMYHIPLFSQRLLDDR